MNEGEKVQCNGKEQYFLKIVCCEDGLEYLYTWPPRIT